MNKKLLAMACASVLTFGLLALANPKAAAAETYLQAGYGVASIDPIDKAGTYRTVDYTTIYTGDGNASLKADIDAAAAAGNTALKMVKDSSGNVTSVTYTVQTIQVDCDGDGNKNDGYFSVPLAGYGSTDSRMSTGKMDENGDGKITNADGNRIVCTAVTDPQGQTVLFFTLDLISSADFAPTSIRQKISNGLLEANSAWYVPCVNMMFTASHTHSSPDTGISNSYALPINAAQRAYEVLIVDRAIEAAKLAMADRVAVTASQGEIEATNMNSTRHYNITEQKAGKTSGTVVAKETWTYGDNFGGGLPSDEYVMNGTGSYIKGSYKYTLTASNVSKADNTLHLIQLTPVSGSKKPIVMVNFRAHPKLNSTATTQYGLDNRSCTSADYVASLREKMEIHGYRAAFYQGAAGNQNTFNYLDDSALGPQGKSDYSWLMQRHTTAINSTTTYDCYNDRMSFISYTKSGVTHKLQTGYSYGSRLADYALDGLEKNMTPVEVDNIKVDQTYFEGVPQLYSAGLTAAAIQYKEVEKKTSGAFKYYYTDPNGKESGYYNINSIYHANTVYGRRNAVVEHYNAKLQLSCITIGELAFVTAPNEMYDRYNDSGDQVNNNLWDTFNASAVNAGYRTPLFLGYTNGSEGYIPNVAAYEYNRANNNKGTVIRPTSGGEMIIGVGAYEANTSKLSEGDGEDVIRHFQKMLLNMKNITRSSTCPMCGATGVVWEAIGEPGTTQLYGGHYYLSDDLTYYGGSNAYQRTVHADSCIDLNGHTAGNSSDKTGRSFVVMTGVTLRMMNGTCEGRGTDSSGNGGVIYMYKNSKLYLDHVDLVRLNCEGQTAAIGGVIYADTGCTLDIRNGSITGGVASGGTGNNDGGNIYLGENSSLTMKNVTVSGGVAKRGGNLFIRPGGTLDLENVTMLNDTDNMFVLTKNVHIYGDTVLKGRSYFNSGDNATTKISGNVQAWESADGTNIQLETNTRLTFGELADTAKISIRGGAAATDTTGLQYAGKQLVADQGYYLDDTFTNRGVFLGDKWMCECGGMVEESAFHTHEYHAYTKWSSTTSLPTLGNYYLSNDVTLAYQASPNANYKMLRFDLNGHSITHKVAAPATADTKPADTRVYYVGKDATLVITDTVGTGRLTRDLSNLSATQKAMISESGLCVGVDFTGTFRMYGGTMDGTGQTSTGAGGAVTGMNAASSIQIFGGTIKGITGKTAGCISNGPVLLAGGTLQGGKATSGVGGVYMADNAETTILTLTGDATVDGNFKSNGTTESNIYCAAGKFVISGVYTGTASLSISSPSRGKVVATSDNADITGATLKVDNNSDYQFVTTDTQVKITTTVGMKIKQIKGGNEEYYLTMEEAIADYWGTDSVLTLLTDMDSVNITASVKIDLAGHSIGAITQSNGVTARFMDSATDDFKVEDAQGYGTVPATANTVAIKGYVKILEGDKASFHRLDLTLNKLTLRPCETGLYYNSRFGGDEIIKAHMSEFGVALRAGSAPDEAYIREDTDKKTHWGYAADLWVVNSGDNSANGVMLQGILKQENGYLINKRNAETSVYGVSYVILDGQMILGASADYTLQRFCEQADLEFEKQNDTQKEAIGAMYEAYKTLMVSWNIPNIKAYAEK